MTGGQSMVLEATYLGTLVQRELQALLDRGGVLAGDSAGAIAIGCFWLTMTPEGFGKRTDDLCLLPKVAVSPHANRPRDYSVDSAVLGYLANHSGPMGTIGIDIDENTVLVLKMGTADVFGTGNVSFIDVARDAQKPYLRLSPGQRHDLAR